MNVELSKREREVATLIARGRMDKQIAADLEISLGTVRVYWKRFAEKVGGSTRTETILLAVRAGLIDMADAPATPLSSDGVEILRALTFTALKAAHAMNERGFGSLAGELKAPAERAADLLTRLGVSIDPEEQDEPAPEGA